MAEPTLLTPERTLAAALFSAIIRRTSNLDGRDGEEAMLILWRSLSRHLAVKGRGRAELLGWINLDAVIPKDKG